MSIRPRIGQAILCTSVGLVSTLGTVQSASAQSAQPYSAQLAAMATTISYDGQRRAGVGIEPQFRINRLYSTEDFGAISLGLGGQYTYHIGGGDKLQVVGLFAEPRWALPFSVACAFPYLSARLSVQRVIGDFVNRPSGGAFGNSVGGGAGITFRMTPSANLDFGAQLVRQEFRSIGNVNFSPALTYVARVGLTLGLSR